MTEDVSPRRERMRRLLRLATHLFIAVHLVAIITWDLPIPDQWRRPFRPYVQWVGLWQSWSMFAPDPLSVNVRAYAQITYRDGRSAVWDLDRYRTTRGWLSRYRRDRYRKWVMDHVRRDDHSTLWPDAARFVARQPDVITVGEPETVALVRHWRPIRLTLLPSHRLVAAAERESSYRYYSYQVPRP